MAKTSKVTLGNGKSVDVVVGSPAWETYNKGSQTASTSANWASSSQNIANKNTNTASQATTQVKKAAQNAINQTNNTGSLNNFQTQYTPSYSPQQTSVMNEPSIESQYTAMLAEMKAQLESQQQAQQQMLQQMEAQRKAEEKSLAEKNAYNQSQLQNVGAGSPIISGQQVNPEHIYSPGVTSNAGGYNDNQLVSNETLNRYLQNILKGGF